MRSVDWSLRDGDADGLGMLVEQAAEAFFAWRVIKPSGADPIRSLRAG